LVKKRLQAHEVEGKRVPAIRRGKGEKKQILGKGASLLKKVHSISGEGKGRLLH